MADPKPKKTTSSPAGLYDGTITAQRLIVPEDETKCPYFEVDVNVTHRITADTNQPVPLDMALKRQARLYFSDGTMQYLPQKLAALGFHGKLDQLDDKNKNHISVVGNKCRLLNKPKAGEGKNAGKTFDEFQPFFGSERVRPETTSGAGKRLNMLFGDRFTPLAPLEQVESKTKPSPPAKAPANVPDDAGGEDPDDEVPF